MDYILHRKINQPKSGRRLILTRRHEELSNNPERRSGLERRLIADRRKSNH